MIKKHSDEKATIRPMIEWAERVFDALNAHYFLGLLPKSVIIIQQDVTKGAYGWFTPWEAWTTEDGEGRYTEITLTAENMTRPIADIAGTLLHEMCHAENYRLGIKDTSRGGTYHNKKFAICAERHGLVVSEVERYGYARTELAEETTKWLAHNGFLEKDFDIKREALLKKKRVTKSHSIKYVCPCCGAIARTTKEMLLVCGECQEVMETR